MVNLTHRMTKLTALLQMRVGPGAAILPPEVERIHLDFASVLAGGHSGARQFWRNELRRLKYYNPSVTMTVSRVKDTNVPAVMEIHYKNADATTASELSSATPPPTDTTENPKVIDMKNIGASTILERLILQTNARIVSPTEEDLKLVQEVKEKKERGRKDSLLLQQVNKSRKELKEKELLARGGMANLAES